MIQHFKSFFAFGLVGVAAMATQLGAVIVIVELTGLHPLSANILGFLVAFNVSYWGHRHLSFPLSDRSIKRTLPSFLGIAILSFLINELLFFILLHYTDLHYQTALIIVLLCVGAITFITSKLWAFKHG